MYWPEFITVSVCNSHTWTHKELDPAVLHALPKLPLDWVLLHLKQEAGCIYVNNVGPWNAIMYLGNHSLVLPYQHCSVLHYVVQFCSEKFLMSCLRKKAAEQPLCSFFEAAGMCYSIVLGSIEKKLLISLWEKFVAYH